MDPIPESASTGRQELQLIADSLPGLIAYVDRDRRYRFNNAAYERWFGAPGKAATGRHLWEVLGTAAYEAIRGRVDAVLAGEPQSFESRVPYQEGGTRDVHVDYVPHRDDRGAIVGFYALILDITEQKRAEAHLKLLETCIARLNDIVIVTEAEPIDEPGPRIVFVNDAFVRRTGYAREEVLGRSPRFLQGPKTSRAELDRVRTAMRRWEPVRVEVVNYAKGGEEFWVEMDIVPVADATGWFTHWVAVERDVTARKEAEEAVREREMRLGAVLETAADAIITIDERGIISSMNPATERIFGYTSAELIGRNVNVLMPEPFQGEHDGYLSRYVATGVKRIIGIGREVQGQRKDGTVFPVELSVSEILDGQRWFTGIVRDITRRKELEREVLESATEEERRIGRELHDGVGQELTGLGLLADALARQLAGASGSAHPLAAKLLTGVQRVHEQVRTLCRDLVLAELDAEGLRTALEELALRTAEQSGVECIFDCPDPVRISNPTTAKHLYRIAQEAVSNALRHGKPHQVRIGLHATPHGMRLSVADDGIGIAGESANLWTSNGLGVSTMRYRANLIGGALHIGPAEGKGVLVICTVPQEDDDGE